MGSKIKNFNCISCGECCRHIHLVKGLVHLQIGGVCKYLVDNKCSIYDNRPDLCRYDKVFDMLKNQISIEEYDKLSVYYCSKLQELKNFRDGK